MADRQCGSLLTSEVGQRNLLMVLEPVIIKHLTQPSTLLKYLAPSRVLTLDMMRAINDKERWSPEEAVKLLLKCLQQSSNPRWFIIFKDALKEQKQSILWKRLNLENVKDGKKYEKLLQYHFPKLMDVKACDVMTQLYQNGVIQKEDMELIQAAHRSNENEYAMRRLLLEIPYRNEDWFYHLINALKANGYQALINEIHSDLNKAETLASVDRVDAEIEPRSCDSSYQPTMTSREDAETVPKIQRVLPFQGAEVSQDLDTETNLKCWKTRPEDDVKSEASVGGKAATSASVEEWIENSFSQPLDASVSEDGVPDSVGDDDEFEDFNLDLHSVASGAEGVDERLGELSLHGASYTFRTTTSEVNEEDTTLTNAAAREQMSRNRQLANRNNALTGRPVFEALKLRDYQKELAVKAVQGYNCLIIAPTGSGKTHVAMYIAKDHLSVKSSDGRPRKIIFFVPTVALVDQQLDQFQKYMETGCRCAGLSGEEAPTLDINELANVNDVFVMTPQILLNCLNDNKLDSLCVFTLLIFDECHRMTGNYPYNTLMGKYYVDEKLAGSRISDKLPQVIGMTASPGSGSGCSSTEAAEHILQLCANMDATEISTVKSNINELDVWVNRPFEFVVEVRRRENDRFLQKISAVMAEIENEIKSRPDIRMLATEVHDIHELIKPPADRDAVTYVHFVTKLRRAIAVVEDQGVRRFFMPCLQHLAVYNKALMINADCRTKDGLEYIRKEFAASAPQPGNTTKPWLEGLFKAIEPELQRISDSPESSNPKLDEMERTILSFYADNPNSQGIIFFKTRETTTALVNWIKATPSLAPLNPHNLVGSASALKGGMTRNKLEDVLKYFKGGVHKIIVATSVAEEGLDVAKCNYVILYEYTTNDIARVQTRGRARARGAKYVLVAERGRGNLERNETNKQREIMTSRALEQIYGLTPDIVQKKILNFQMAAKSQRDIEAQTAAIKEAFKKSRSHEVDHELRCVECDSFVAWSSDLRVIEKAHHVTLDDSFQQRVVFKPHGIPCAYDDWMKTHKVHCKKCNNDWGIRATYKGIPCCVIKVEHLVVIDPRQRRFSMKKWKNVPFSVAEFSLEEDLPILSENAAALSACL